MNRSTRRSLAASALVFAICFAFGGESRAEPVGFVAAVSGDAQILSGTTQSWSPARVDADVQLDDTVRTGADGSLKLLLNDDTTLSIGPDTELRVDAFVVGAEATGKRSILEMARGRLRAWIGEIFGSPSRIEVHTPTAVIGVKGTAYDLWVEELDGGPVTFVCVTHGAIYVENRDPRIGGLVELSEGGCARIDAEAAPRQLATPPERPPFLAGDPGNEPTEPPTFASLQPTPEIESLMLQAPPAGPGQTPPVALSPGEPAPPGSSWLANPPFVEQADPGVGGIDDVYGPKYVEDPIQGILNAGIPFCD